MSELTSADLLPYIREYYPVGFPPEADIYDAEGLLPHQRTPEHQRWVDAWMKALHQEPQPWNALVDHLRAELPECDFGTYTPVCHTACYVALIYLRRTRQDGQEDHRLLRVAGAVSLIAPVYLIYGTAELVPPRPPDARSPKPQLILPPTPEMQPYADIMARAIERTFGYKRLPLELAHLQVPGFRLFHLHYSEQPTLLNALFMSHLEGLP